MARFTSAIVVGGIIGAPCLGGCAGHAQPPASTIALGRPITTTPSVPPQAPISGSVPPPSHASRFHPRSAGADGWQGDPDGPLPPNSSWRPPLAAARRFAAAYVRYETGALTAPVERAIAASCTAALARALLAHPALIPPAVDASEVAERIRAVDPLERLPGGVLVLLAVTRTIAGNTSSGALELQLVQTHGRWLVDGVSVLS